MEGESGWEESNRGRNDLRARSPRVNSGKRRFSRAYQCLLRLATRTRTAYRILSEYNCEQPPLRTQPLSYLEGASG